MKVAIAALVREMRKNAPNNPEASIVRRVDGPLTKRHRPRQMIVINPEEAEWVNRANLLDPVDLRGLPRLDGDQAVWCPPAFCHAMEAECCFWTNCWNSNGRP